MGQYFVTLTGHQTNKGDPWLRDITSEGPKSTERYNGAANVELGVQAGGPGSIEIRAARRSGPSPFDCYNGAQPIQLEAGQRAQQQGVFFCNDRLSSPIKIPSAQKSISSVKSLPK